MKQFLTVTALFASTMLMTGTVFAAGGAYQYQGQSQCQPIYGGGQVCVQSGNIVVNKTVQNPKTLTYVDNLGMNDIKYSPDQTINFQITVSNVSDNEVQNIKVVDTLPQYVLFTSGPGTYDPKANTLTFTLSSLAGKKSQTFTVTGRIASYDTITQTGITCVVNQAMETSNNQTSTDNAQFCIEKPSVTPTPGVPMTTKGGLPIYPPKATTTPPTGPETLALFALLPSAAAGFFLRKKSK